MASTAALPLHPHRPLAPTTVPPGPGGRSRPHLRVVEGGRAPAARARRATYLRRRAAAAVLALAVLAGAVLLASAALAGLAGGGHPSAATGASPSGAYVVQPGDTLWSIAAAVAPESDVRITVDQLSELNGGSRLVAGQRLLLP